MTPPSRISESQIAGEPPRLTALAAPLSLTIFMLVSYLFSLRQPTRTLWSLTALWEFNGVREGGGKKTLCGGCCLSSGEGMLREEGGGGGRWGVTLPDPAASAHAQGGCESSSLSSPLNHREQEEDKEMADFLRLKLLSLEKLAKVAEGECCTAAVPTCWFLV